MKIGKVKDFYQKLKEFALKHYPKIMIMRTKANKKKMDLKVK